MKKFILAAIAFLGFAFAASAQLANNNNNTANFANAPAFSWKAVEHDFGNIPQGTPVTAEFTFTNSGTAPIILSEVKPSCGCTAADYSKEPIAPGKTGYIKATYNAASVGSFTKSVTVKSNVGEGTQILILKGTVVAKQ
ncbi:MAG: DUF1573 domain-containing protein [Flammeovirgaceae bacterium]